MQVLVRAFIAILYLLGLFLFVMGMGIMTRLRKRK